MCVSSERERGIKFTTYTAEYVENREKIFEALKSADNFVFLINQLFFCIFVPGWKFS
jgi:hypothetical protein